MKRQVLHIFPGIWPGGGPAGYAYNLRKALMSCEEKTPIIIMSPVSPLYESPLKKEKTINNSLRGRFKNALKLLCPRLYGVLVAAIGYCRFRKILDLFTDSQISEMESSQVLVFHEWRLAYAYLRKIGRRNGQKVLLMPHSPVEWAREYTESLEYHYGRFAFWKFLYHLYVWNELRTWEMCDGIIVPSRHSLEGYFAGSCISSVPIFELPTGIEELRMSRPPQETLKIWGVSPKTRICGFFGRRHPHKGYDIFCEIAREALRSEHNLMFVSAGNGPIPWPNLPNFRHLGYLNDRSEIANAISACDIIIAPNRMNYFDLIILEAMSLGKVVITTKVGGAKSFASPGVFLVELSESVVEDILRLISHLISDPDTLSRSGRINRLVYEEQFSIRVFSERHQKLALELLRIH